MCISACAPGKNRVKPSGLTFYFSGRKHHEQSLYQRRVRLHPQCASIKCTVTNCAHHCKDVDNCGLTAIQVGTHESRPTMDQCTDCQSYQKCQ